jgi:protein-tyrosine phosphatase
VASVFVDVHSHVVPSGDDGAQNVEEGLELCRAAAARGTSVLFATPHVWPHLVLTEERELAVRAAYEEMAASVALDLRLGFELTPSPRLLDDDLNRYRLDGLDAVLMEVPFHGSLRLAEALAEYAEGFGLTPVIAHPERSGRVVEAPGSVAAWHERGWLLQLNSTSLLGYHGPDVEATAWTLVERGLADLVGSDGHRVARPPFLDEAYRLVRARLNGREGVAARLFDGRALGLAAADRLDLAQRG